MDEQSIYTQYATLEKTYETKYGDQTVLFYQVGSFFELYGPSRDPESKLAQLGDLCHLHISEKKNSGPSVVYMAGFRDYTLDKYLERVTEHGYTAVVYVQEKEGKQVTRKLSGIYSPGTYLPTEDMGHGVSNYILCIWFHIMPRQQKLIIGYSALNSYTGESVLHEYETAAHIEPATFDEVERAIAVYQPSEILVLSTWDAATMTTVLQYCGWSRPVHHVLLTETSPRTEQATRATQQTYQSYLLERRFGHGFVQDAVWSHYPIATQACCYLLSFLEEHHPSLVQQLRVPTIGGQATHRMVLANHTLRQLHLLSTSGGPGLIEWLDHCVTVPGKRLHREQLTQPTWDTEWLNQEWKRVQQVLNEGAIDSWRDKLRGLKDLDKVARQLLSRRVSPSTFVGVVDTLNRIVGLVQQIPSVWELPTLLNIETKATQIRNHIEEHVDVAVAISCTTQNGWDQAVMKIDQTSTLAQVWESFRDTELRIHTWRQELANLLGAPVEQIKLHETEKLGLSLQLTKTRAKTLKQALTKAATTVKTIAYDVPLTDIHTVSASGSYDEIVFPALSQTLRQWTTTRIQIQEENRKAFDAFVTSMETHISTYHMLSRWIAQLDVWWNKAYIARRYRYCCPTVKVDTQAWVHATAMRHPLLEQLTNNTETYVPNDVSLGNHTPRGVVLYGHNTSGKTSLLRALGVCVIMAQSGWYVPCDTFTWSPFRAIYSRILSNDNVFKHLSSFAVEMNELRVILRAADTHSLVLADELCHSTEQESAVSLVVATLRHLAKQGACYFMTTHFHDIPMIPEIQDLVTAQHLAFHHLHVRFCHETQKLILDRQIKPGTGSRSYGLEISRALHLPEEFLEEAFAIRSRHFGSLGTLSFPTSRYNRNKIRGVCEKCGMKLAEETHHVVPQRECDEEGFLPQSAVSKNHVANLLALCHRCHGLEHHPVAIKKVSI